MIDKKALAFDNKYVLILYLYEQKKIEIQQIVKLNPQQAAEYFDKEMPDLITEALKMYVNKNLSAIKKSGFFFPGRDEGPAKVNSILSGLRKYLIKNGRSLAEIGLTSRTDVQKDGIPEEIDNAEDVVKALKNLFK